MDSFILFFEFQLPREPIVRDKGRSKNILICYPQVPFVKGGTELLVESLRDEFLKRGHNADLVCLPFQWNPKPEIIKNCMAWRLLDLTGFEGRKIDLVIATKFPSYLVKHPRKITYLFHQFRQAYDAYGTEYGCFDNTPEDNRIREMIIKMDNRFLPESRRLFAISQNVAGRLKRYNNLDSEVLYPPPRRQDRFSTRSYGDYLLYVGRLNRSKRLDLLIKALPHTHPEVRCLIAGTGEEQETLERLAVDSRINGRVQFLGQVSDGELMDLYADCFAVFYAPHDEDYGLISVEAYSAKKPVITTTDSGGVLEFVQDGVTGCVASPDPTSIAGRIDNLFINRSFCQKMGEAGNRKIRDVTWEKVIEKLTSTT